MNNKTKKIRLDVYLFSQKFFESREQARIAIMEGKVYVNNQKEDKPGTMIKEDSNVEVRSKKLKYVSRGGYKLEKAINCFNIDLFNKNCVDIGSSTGGFTDCMLQNGAKMVFAIDCGTNQLDYKLRIDDRVVVMENTNARYIILKNLYDAKVIKEKKINDYDNFTDEEIKKILNINFISVDVSFISLDKIIPAIKNLLMENGEAVFLIKPQFEAGKEKVQKNGVVKDEKVHIEVIKYVIKVCYKNELEVLGIDFSPIKGPAGNIEFLLYVKNAIGQNAFDDDIINKVVINSHKELN